MVLLNPQPRPAQGADSWGAAVDHTQATLGSMPRREWLFHARDVDRLEAFVAFQNLEHNFFAFLEGPEAFHGDGRVVDKDVRAVVLGDEPIALLVVEPLDTTRQHALSRSICSFRHCFALSQLQNRQLEQDLENVGSSRHQVRLAACRISFLGESVNRLVLS